VEFEENDAKTQRKNALAHFQIYMWQKVFTRCVKLQSY
jgi:hypothetical protein